MTGRGVRLLTSHAGSLWATTVATAAASLAAAGCAAGCGDVRPVDTVQVVLDDSTVDDAYILEVTVCQADRCDSVIVPATEFVIAVPITELDPRPDPDQAGQVTAEVRSSTGEAMGSTIAPFDFSTQDNGPSCPTAREQRVAVTSS